MPNSEIVNPHFKVPFEFQQGSAVCVEQDSQDEVTQCVSAILRTPKGFRLEIPDFGTDSLLLDEGSPALEIIETAIETWEPRAVYTLSLKQLEDILSSTIQVNVGVANAK